MFRVIVGGKAGLPTRSDVLKEAERRISASGHRALGTRQIATGAAMPREIRYLPMQIQYAAEAISALDPIPFDYSNDKYWPHR